MGGPRLTSSIRGRKASRPRASMKQTATSGNRQAARRPSLTVSRPELLIDGSDRRFRHLVHDLFSFLACHEEIRSGQYAAGWIKENETGRTWFEAKRKEERAQQIERVGAELRALMPFLKPVYVAELEGTVTSGRNV